MATQHTFAPFNPPNETWESYVARFECFLIANSYTELSGDRKRAYFLGFCGTEMFETALALFAPKSIHTVTWEELLEKLKDHYAPPPSRCARRYAFYHRNQGEGESINQYVAALRKAALYCEFSDLEDYLLDRLVFGVRDSRLKRRLLSIHGLTFKTALDEARTAELSCQSLAEMDGGGPTTDPPARTNAVESLPDAFEQQLTMEDDVYRVSDTPRGTVPRNRITPSRSPCMGCGGDHPRAFCSFKDAICRRCGRRSHIARVCRAGRPPPLPQTHRDSSFAAPKGVPGGAYSRRDACNTIYHRASRASYPLHANRLCPGQKISVTVMLGGVPCPMEVDTGSALSLASWSTVKRIFPRMAKGRLDPCPFLLRDYQGSRIPVLGKGMFPVTYKGFAGKLPLVVVDGPLQSLLGLDWFSKLGLSIQGINTVQGIDMRAQLEKEFPSVFDGQLGKYTGSPVTFNLDPLVAPVRLKPRRVPLALRPRVDAEIDRLLEQGILEPVDHSPWETPIVTPVKPDGSIRLCADYRCTVNRALPAHAYPVPVVQHLLHSLGRGKVFAKIDLSQAYQQLPVDAQAAEAQTIITHRGAFRCRRLQFGISTAPGIFQSLMERLLYGIPGTVPYFDDVLVTAATHTELLTRVRQVLAKFQEVGLRVKGNKCVFAAPSVEFLGFLVDAQGIHPTPAKTKAIVEAPAPSSKQELQAFLGLLNFYAIFLPHKAAVAEPLHRLLDVNTPWRWGPREQQSFTNVKRLLTSNAVLTQYSDHLPLTLACDASPYGVGAVLSHLLPNGTEAPIAFFSRTLATPERAYGQIDKEALALVAGVRRFHHYLYGRHFNLITDHQPLLGIFSKDRPTPQMLSPRMTRWSVFLANYDYHLLHRPGKHIAHADALSRCPLPLHLEDPAPASTVLSISELNLPLTALDIARAAAKDQVLARVTTRVLRGWPSGPEPPELTPFKARHTELSVLRGCLLWGDRVVIPRLLQPTLLDSLHRGHPGIVRMKALARGYVWWPGIDKDIESRVAQCQRCQVTRANPPRAQPLPWEAPATPWSRLHIDLAGPIKGQMLLVIVDAHSKWVEICLVPTTTSEAIIRALTLLFATHGHPDVVVSDNGPQFTSATFEGFLASLGIKHMLMAPWHPASNGMAERAVRSAKESLLRLEGGDWHQKLGEMLLAQHTTPCATTNKSPAELLMGRRLRTTLDRLHPLYVPETPLDSARPDRAFQVGATVYARNYVGSPKWVPGVVKGICGPRSYTIALSDGREWRRHVDQLRTRGGTATDTHDHAGLLPFPREGGGVSENPQHPPRLEPRTATLPVSMEGTLGETPAGEEKTPGTVQPEESVSRPDRATGELRRSTRVRRRPAYLADYACSYLGERDVTSRTASRGSSYERENWRARIG